MITDVQNGFSSPTHLTPAYPSSTGTQQTIRGTPLLGSVAGTRLRVKSMTWLTTLCLWRLSVGWVHSCTCTPWGATVMRLSHAFQMPEIQESDKELAMWQHTKIGKSRNCGPWWKISTTCIQCGLIQWMKPSSLGQPVVSMHTQKV